MDFFQEWLTRNQEIFHVIIDLSKKRNTKLYLVGGALRDLLMGRQKSNPDIDFCLEKDAISFGREVAAKLRAGFVVLDEEHGFSRVVKKTGKGFITLDFTDFRGRNLKEDLKHRDFSINSLALELNNVFTLSSRKKGRAGGPARKESSCRNSNRELKRAFIDLSGGIRDLKSRKIRMVHNKVFDEDPLRILRAFSLAALFGFKIERKTAELIKRKRLKLKNVSPERIRDEIFKVLSVPGTDKVFLQLDSAGILQIIFPEIRTLHKLRQGGYHHLDVWKHTLETIKNFELISADPKKTKGIDGYLNEEISGGRRRYELVKLAALLHDIGKPKTFRIENNKVQFHGHEHVGAQMGGDIGERLKLSNEEVRMLRRIIFFHLRPGYLVMNPVLTLRAKYRFFRDAESEAVSVLLLSLADQRATRGYLRLERSRRRHERVSRLLIREYFSQISQEPVPRIINGDDIISEFKLKPSPLVGKILREVEELRAIGKIKTREEALGVSARLIKKYG